MRIRLQGPGHAAGLLSELNRCRQSRMYCDVFLQVGNRSFSAHRAVLACAGAHFRSLFARAQSSSTTAVSLEFISPASFEKVLTFIYTGEIVTDLIDVGVLYELAERLGVSELVRACHSTFPDMQASVTTNCKAICAGDLSLDSNAAADATAAVSVSALSACSSAASCSSLSSSAAPTPAAAPSPLLQNRTPRDLEMNQTSASLSLHLKTEDVQSNMGYGQISTESQLTTEHSVLTKSQPHRVLPPPGPTLPQLKTEMGEGEHEAGARGICGDGDGRMAVCRGMASSSLAQTNIPVPSDSSCSFADPSAQHGTEVCTPAASSGNPLGSLQVGAPEGVLVAEVGAAGGGAVDGGAVDVAQDERLMYGQVEAGRKDEERDPLQGSREMMEGTEEDEQWGQLAGEIIELSDDENYMEEDEEEDDEDDLVCVENGNGTNAGGQVTGSAGSCKACAAPLPADPAALSAHAESHLTETGLCRVCGASFSDHAAGIIHALLHVGVQLFSCDICHLQFCSQNKLLRHRRSAAAGYTLPQGALTGASHSLGPELQCGVCSKTLTKDLQTVRDHLLSHVCSQSLSCGVCHLPQLSLCSLLWHALNHLNLAVYSCPHCAHSFLERSQLDRHMALHAEEAAAKEREQQRVKAGADVVRGAAGEAEEMRCFLCPQTFRSSSAFQYHLSLHTTESIGNGTGSGGQGWSGKRRADQMLEGSPSSSSSPREAGSLVKMTNLGFGLGMGFGLSDKLLQGPAPGFPMGLLNNGSGSGLDGAAAAACPREKWYRCRYCGKRFAHSGEFTYHLRIHTGEKPYQCKVCLRFFRGRSTMICHLKTHAGALMYRCTVCGLYFSTLKMVSSHMEVHKDHLPPDFNIEQTFMYNDHSKEPLPPMDT